MLRSFFLISILFASVMTTKGQIAQWLIQPEYDNIGFADNEDIIITELNGVKQLWDFNGHQLSATGIRDIIHPFAEGHAVVTTPDRQTITGFYNTNGTFTALNYMVAHASTRFNNGYLIAFTGEYFVDQHGTLCLNNLIEAWPFSGGYASCRAYKNFEKKKDPYPLLLSSPDLQEVTFTHNGNTVKNDDIDFISSVNREGIGIVIIKEKVFLFDGTTRKLKPLYATKGGSADKKDKQVKVQILPEMDSNGLQISAYDKQRTVTISFDDNLAPSSIRYANGETQDFEEPAALKREFNSQLQVTQEKYNPQGLYGLNWGEDLEILPPQLEKVSVCFDNNAIVRLNNKWGILRIFKDDSFEVSLNKGNYIAFKHKTIDVPIRLNVPAKISTGKTKLEMVYGENENPEENYGCRILPQTARATKSYDGILPGYIDYECELDYPPYIPDEINKDDMTQNEINYKAQVIYDNLRSPIIPIKTYGWQYKYITPVKSDEVIQNGTYSCKIELKRDKDPGEQTYPIDVTISSDTLFNEITKISDNLYTITVHGLNEGINTFEVTLSEGDEQISIDTSFEIEVTYQKPTKKTVDPQPVKSTIRPKKKTKRSTTKTKPEEEPFDLIWH